MAGANDEIKKAIQRISGAGNIKAIQVLTGFVTEVFPEGDERYGTINFASLDQTRYITNVSLSATQANDRGQILLPAEDSEVTIMLLNNVDGYVISYSHLDRGVVDVNSSYKIIATGVEDVDDNTDYDEVAKTGTSTSTEYTPDRIETSAIDTNSGTENIQESSSSENRRVVSNSNSGKSSELSQTATEIKLLLGEAFLKQTELGTEVKSSLISLSNGGATQPAVLGTALTTVLNAFIDQVGQILTTTAMGAMPILNAAAVLALKAQVAQILSSVNLIE